MRVLQFIREIVSNARIMIDEGSGSVITKAF